MFGTIPDIIITGLLCYWNTICVFKMVAREDAGTLIRSIALTGNGVCAIYLFFKLITYI